MDAAARPAISLTREAVPAAPGVYAWYRSGKRMYVGKANSLRARLWGNHLGQSIAPSSSAFRRNVAEHLGFGEPAALKLRRVRLTERQLANLRKWIVGCQVAWLTCSSGAAAAVLERRLKIEFKPPLTKR